jgi:hypothetical protein
MRDHTHTLEIVGVQTGAQILAPLFITWFPLSKLNLWFSVFSLVNNDTYLVTFFPTSRRYNIQLLSPKSCHLLISLNFIP